MQFELPLTLETLNGDPPSSDTIANHVTRLKHYRRACRVSQFIGCVAAPLAFVIFMTPVGSAGITLWACGTVLLALVLISVTTAVDASLLLALQRYEPISDDKRAELIHWSTDESIARYLERVLASPRELSNHEFTLLRFKWSIRNYVQRSTIAQ